MANGPARPGSGYFDPGVTPTEKMLTDVNVQGGPSAVALMSPQERDAYLKAQQQNTDNVGKGWSDNGAYDAYATALKSKYADDPNRDTRVMGGIQGAQQVATNGWNGAADINAYQMGGDPAFAAQERERLMAKGAAAEGRTGPTIDTSTVTPWQSGALTAGLHQVDSGNQQMGAGGLLYNQAASGGAGTGLEGQAGNRLMGLAAAPAGPSAAEMAMRRAGDQSVQQQASLAAGARGGNSALALQNAAANQANVMGNTQQQVGIQRAQEDMANKTFQANALTGAANVYGAQNSQQIQAGQAAGSTYGGAGSTYGGAGQTFANQANTNATIASNNASLEGQQRGRNDDLGYKYDTSGSAAIAKQTDLNTDYDKSRLDAYIRSRNSYGNPDNSGRGTLTGSASADKAISTGVQVAATVAPFLSDVRAKKDIAPADAKISDAFRSADQSAGGIRGANVGYPTLPQPPTLPTLVKSSGRAPMATDIKSRVYDDKPIAPQTPDYLKAPPRSALAADIPYVTESPQYGSALSRENPFLSDVRSKSDIRSAGPDISGAFRQASGDAAKIRGGQTQYPLGEYNGYGAEEPGNIDLSQRPYVRNAGGSVSTVLSMGANVGGREVLMPMVSPEGRIMSQDEAVAQYQRTGQHLGKYRDARSSDAAGEAIHLDQMRNPPRDTLMGAGSAARGPVPLDYDSYSDSFVPPASRGATATPGYEYRYKDPDSPGARPGPQYGIMAQDLEKTPAGASVVGEKDGRKFVDPGRLSLLTAAEVSKQRQELDALKGMASQIRGASVDYPTTDYGY